MADEVEVPVEPVEEAVKGLTPEDVQKLIAEAVGETNKNWQSKFDKVLTEKKQTETKALTVEEQIAQLKAEREREKIDWTRKEAKAKAGIDDELEQAIGSYLSTDSEAIADGARGLAEYVKAKQAPLIEENTALKAKVSELEKKLTYGGRVPAGGGNPPTGSEVLEAKRASGDKLGFQSAAIRAALEKQTSPTG